jgi:hypothetical protein
MRELKFGLALGQFEPVTERVASHDRRLDRSDQRSPQALLLYQQ